MVTVTEAGIDRCEQSMKDAGARPRTQSTAEVLATALLGRRLPLPLWPHGVPDRIRLFPPVGGFLRFSRDEDDKNQ